MVIQKPMMLPIAKQNLSSTKMGVQLSEYQHTLTCYIHSCIPFLFPLLTQVLCDFAFLCHGSKDFGTAACHAKPLPAETLILDI